MFVYVFKVVCGKCGLCGKGLTEMVVDLIIQDLAGLYQKTYEQMCLFVYLFVLCFMPHSTMVQLHHDVS